MAGNDGDLQREELRKTFDKAADLYQRARPEYPRALFDHLISVTGLRAGDQLLEIGCATGKATLPLARPGFRITCVELGARLAAAARRNLAAFPDVEVSEGSFETWAIPPRIRFDLVVAATTWHWIDPAVRYVKAWEALRPEGTSPGSLRRDRRGPAPGEGLAASGRAGGARR